MIPQHDSMDALLDHLKSTLDHVVLQIQDAAGNCHLVLQMQSGTQDWDAWRNTEHLHARIEAIAHQAREAVHNAARLSARGASNPAAGAPTL